VIVTFQKTFDIIIEMTVLIIHGIEGHAGIHWQKWLHDNLIEKGFKVIMPNLPSSNHPIRFLWLQAIKKELQNYSYIEYGKYSDDKELDLHKPYIEAIKPTEIKFSLSKIDDEKLYERPNPISLSGYDLELYNFGSHFYSHIIYLGKIKKWKDLLEYWNLRAAGKEVMFLPFEYYQEMKNQIIDTTKSGNYKINQNVKNNALLTKSQNITTQELKIVNDWIKTITTTPFVVSGNFFRWRSTDSFDDVIVSNLRNNESEDIVNMIGSEITPFKYINPTILDKSDRLSHKERAYASIINVSGAYRSKYAFTFPIDPNVEDLVQRDFLMTAIGDARISREGITIYRKWATNTCTIRPVESYKVIKAIFKTIGFEVERSHPGIVAENMIELLGDIEPGDIEDVRVLKIKGVRKLFDLLSAKTTINSKKINTTFKKVESFIDSIPETNADLIASAKEIHSILESVREIDYRKEFTPDRIKQIIKTDWKTEYDSLTLYYKQSHPLTPEIIFDYLVKRELLLPGIKFRCSSCQENNWIPLNAFKKEYICLFCRENNKLKIQPEKANWKYRANGLISLPGGGYGSIAVVLAIWRLSHLAYHYSANAHAFTSITLRDRIKRRQTYEVDYLFLVTESSGGYKLVLGEAKGGERNSFERKEFTKILKIASRFKIKPFLCFTTLNDSFNKMEKEQMKKIQSKGYPVIALTSQEIDPYDLYDRFSGLRDKYAIRLEQFAENTRILNI